MTLHCRAVVPDVHEVPVRKTLRYMLFRVGAVRKSRLPAATDSTFLTRISFLAYQNYPRGTVVMLSAALASDCWQR